jgi:hypothetical protein
LKSKQANRSVVYICEEGDEEGGGEGGDERREGEKRKEKKYGLDLR